MVFPSPWCRTGTLCSPPHFGESSCGSWALSCICRPPSTPSLMARPRRRTASSSCTCVASPAIDHDTGCAGSRGRSTSTTPPTSRRCGTRPSGWSTAVIPPPSGLMNRVRLAWLPSRGAWRTGRSSRRTSAIAWSRRRPSTRSTTTSCTASFPIQWVIGCSCAFGIALRPPCPKSPRAS
uniref:Uncharacterized protein n=1 Tax=Arundo donax TaxID=35708 RepID=A0A0A9E2U7_ARUDO